LDPTIIECANVMVVRRRFGSISEFVTYLIREEWERRGTTDSALAEEVQAVLRDLNRRRKSAVEGQSKRVKARSSRSGATA